MNFKSSGAEDIFEGKDTKAARKVLPTWLHEIARRKFDYLAQAARVEQLRIPFGNRLEALSGNREGQHSIRINNRYRVCFLWTEEGGATEIEIVDYH